MTERLLVGPPPHSATPHGPAAGRAARVLTATRTALFGVCLAVQLLLGTTSLVGNSDVYRSWPMALGGFAALLIVTLGYGLLVLGRRRPLSGWMATIGVGIVLAASVMASFAVPAGSHFAGPHWSFGLVGWQLIMLLAGWTIAVTAVSVGAHVVLSVALATAAGVPDSRESGVAAITIVSVTVFQMAAALIARLLYERARTADAAEAERDRLVDHELAARHLHQFWHSRFARQASGALSVLVGITDRTIDLRSEDARLRCARAAAQLRRLFAEHDDVPDQLVHELSAGLDVAEQAGVHIVLAVSGTVQEVPTEVRRELVGAVLGVLLLGPASARVSVLRVPGEVRVAVVCHGLALTRRPPPTDLVVVQHFESHQRTWMEARWSSRSTAENTNSLPSSLTTTQRYGRASSIG